MKVVRLAALRTGYLYLPGNIPSTHFCKRLSRLQGYSAAGRILSMKNSNDTIGNWTRDLPACSAVPQPTAPPRTLQVYTKLSINSNDTIGNRTRDLPACSAVPQPTAPPRALQVYTKLSINSNDTIGNRTRDIPACSAVPQPTAPPRALQVYAKLSINSDKKSAGTV